MRKMSYGMVVCGLVLASGAFAEEPKCVCPAHQAGVPILTKLPYISRLFKCAEVAAPACPEECARVFEQIGIDFEFSTDKQAEVCNLVGQVGHCEQACKAAGCQGAALQVATAKACQCPGECCPDGQCHCTGKTAATETKLWEKIVDLAAGKAAAEAALEAQEESLERSAELLESLAGLHAENAGLEAKLEIQTHLHELTAENTRLKAQVELAEAKAEVMRATVEMTLENERLKMRLAALEQAGGKAARTAARPRNEKKAR